MSLEIYFRFVDLVFLLSFMLVDFFYSHFFFFFNDTATTEIYTLSLHDALPICVLPNFSTSPSASPIPARGAYFARSEEHTSELQSRENLVCRLLLEKKKKKIKKKNE